MKKRERRRYLTERYRDKQVRLSRHLGNRREFDFDRRPRTDFARRHAFICMLKGDYIECDWKSGIDTHPFTEKELGRFKRHSFSDCGRPKCPMCSNPRHNGFGTMKTRLTWQEIVAEQRLKEDLTEFLETEGETDNERD